jgi:hypothetical protein
VCTYHLEESIPTRLTIASHHQKKKRDTPKRWTAEETTVPSADPEHTSDGECAPPPPLSRASMHVTAPVCPFKTVSTTHCEATPCCTADVAPSGTPSACLRHTMTEASVAPETRVVSTNPPPPRLAAHLTQLTRSVCPTRRCSTGHSPAEPGVPFGSHTTTVLPAAYASREAQSADPGVLRHASMCRWR